MAAWRCLLRQISDAPAPFIRSSSAGWHQRPAARMTADRSVSSHRPASGADLQPAGAKPNRRRRSAAKQRHLYVALEDEDKSGFAIHRLDGTDLDDDVRSGSTVPLPPPVVSVSLDRGTERKPRQFAALGSSIITTGMRRVQNSTSYGGVTVIYDTETATLTESDGLQSGLFYGADVAVTAGNRLYLLESSSTPFECCSHSLYYYGGLHCLKATDPNDDDDRPDLCDKAGLRWRCLPESPSFSWSSNSFPPELPFDAESISAHAVHPRGRTIFVSTPSEWKAPLGTFSYSTATGRWKRRGEWLLPFNGPAHYDHDLDAWVGLYLDPEDKAAHLQPTPEVGYLCASRVMTTAGRATHPPEWKKASIQELSSEDQHLKVQLLYMRERRKYCLVEHLDRDKPVLRLTVFRLSYGEDVELVVTVHRSARSYDMTQESFDSQAFWI